MSLDIDTIGLPFVERERNRARGGFDETCLLCGRGMSAQRAERGYWVHLDTANHIVPVDEELPERHDMGWFPIGNDCAKRVPAQYRSRL